MRRLIVVIAVMAAALMQTLDSTIINVALPYIQGNLGATIDQATWVATGFIVANVIVIPLTPWLARRFGRRTYFATSIIGFTLASVACGLAGSLNLLILARVVQGAFGGGLLAVAQPILIDTFPRDQLGTSQGIFTIGAIFGPALGPAVGGVLVDNLDWRWVFFINVPFGIIAALLVIFFLKDPEDAKAIPGDLIGIAFLAVGVGAVQFALDEGERDDWFQSSSIVFASIAGVVGYLGFVLWELFGTKAPIVKLAVFRDRSVAVGSLIGITLGVPLFGSTLILPQYVTNLLGFTASMTGNLILIRALPIALVTPIAGAIVQSGKVDPRVMLACGIVVTGIGSAWQAFLTTSTADFDAFVVPLVMQGVGCGLLFVPLLFSVLGSLRDPEDSPVVSAFINLFFQLGGSIAAAVLVTILTLRQDMHLDRFGRDDHAIARTDRQCVARRCRIVASHRRAIATGFATSGRGSLCRRQLRDRRSDVARLSAHSGTSQTDEYQCQDRGSMMRDRSTYHETALDADSRKFLETFVSSIASLVPYHGRARFEFELERALIDAMTVRHDARRTAWRRVYMTVLRIVKKRPTGLVATPALIEALVFLAENGDLLHDEVHLVGSR